MAFSVKRWAPFRLKSFCKFNPFFLFIFYFVNRKGGKMLYHHKYSMCETSFKRKAKLKINSYLETCFIKH